jgi:hypothetical protein
LPTKNTVLGVHLGVGVDSDAVIATAFQMCRWSRAAFFNFAANPRVRWSTDGQLAINQAALGWSAPGL